MSNEISISHNRRVVYYPRGELLYLLKSNISMKMVVGVGTYLKYFSEAAYVEDDDGKFYGILTIGDVRKSPDMGEPPVNRNCFKLEDASLGE